MFDRNEDFIQKLRTGHKRYLQEIINGKRPGDIPKAIEKLKRLESEGRNQ
jgi:hypothetical protein